MAFFSPTHSLDCLIFSPAMVTMNDEYLTARLGKMYMVPSNEADLSLFVWWIYQDASPIRCGSANGLFSLNDKVNGYILLHCFLMLFRWVRSLNDICAYTRLYTLSWWSERCLSWSETNQSIQLVPSSQWLKVAQQLFTFWKKTRILFFWRNW